MSLAVELNRFDLSSIAVFEHVADGLGVFTEIFKEQL